MMGPMQSGHPAVVGVYCTRAEGERFEWWRYFDGHFWGKGFWIGAQARMWYEGRTWPLNAKERETKKVIYFKEYLPDVS